MVDLARPIGQPPPDPTVIASWLRGLELTIASLADLVVVVDQDLIVVECSGASERVWGMSPTEILGHRMPTTSHRLELIDRAGNTIPPGEAPTLRSLVTRLRQRVEVLGVRRADGTIAWSRVLTVPIFDGNGAPRVISIWTDVTAAIERGEDGAHHEVKLAERIEARSAELESTIGDLQATIGHLEATITELGTFNYSVAHDLRTPARTISALAESLLEEFGAGASASARDLIGRVQRAARRMDTLIGSLLQLSSTELEPRRAPIDISAVGRQELQRLADADPDRHVECIVADGIAGFGDERLVAVILANLLTNAWKFTRGVDQARIEVGVREPADAHGDREYYVRDNGIGFDMAGAGELFVPFHRLPSALEFEGSGVGLAIVYRVITRHGGRVWADSEPGEGATFSFTLPAGTPPSV